MKYIELSIPELEVSSRDLAKKVALEFQPEIVVFIAKGSFLIGQEISSYFNVPLVECFAVRKGNKLKGLGSPILKILPLKIKRYLREQELKSGVHKKKTTRHVYLTNGLELLKGIKRLLIIDDSVDSGITAKEVVTYFQNNLKDREIKFAALNYFLESKSVFEVNFSLYEDTMLSGPWSKDSKEYREFLKRYEYWKKS